MQIASLVVRPSDQRRGVARALLRHPIERHPGRTLAVCTGAGNAPALALYAHFGFEVCRRWLVGPEPLALVELRRPPSATGAPAG